MIWIWLFIPVLAAAWDSDELSLFDLVEEVNQNFYEFLGVQQSAAAAEIRKAYRKKSLQYHPDKSDDGDAEAKFRQLAAIYEILKDEQMRKNYDQVLEFGLPDWRQPVFYYRRMRKMPAWELLVFVMLFITGGHYLVMWASYFEKKLVVDDAFASKLRRKEKKLKRAGVDVDELIEKEMQSIPAPKMIDLLPFVMAKELGHQILNLPQTSIAALNGVKSLCVYISEYRNSTPDDADGDGSANEDAEVREKAPRKSRRDAAEAALVESLSAPVADISGPVSSSVSASTAGHIQSLDDLPRVGSWSTEELSSLIKLTNKYPVGSMDRWERIARAMRRKVQDVTDMVGELKKLAPTEYDKLASGKLGQAQQSSSITIAEANAWLPAPTAAETGDNLEESQSVVAGINGIKKTTTNQKVSKPNHPNKVTNSTTVTKVNNSKKSTTTTTVTSQNNELVKSPNGTVPGLGQQPPSSVPSTLEWAPNQQKCLETALTQHPRGTAERWDRIALCVPGKTKDECISRYKHLASLVLQKKKGTTKAES